ncbi:MAG: VOC family protein [Oligoflexales bacterium]
MQNITPCLWYDNQAEEAAKLYTSIFSKSKILSTARYGKSGSQISGRKEGSVMTVEFEIEGLRFTGLNGGPFFKFSPSVSFCVWCKDEKEIDNLWAKLSEGGSVLMELEKYPWSEKYGWCSDRFGVSWQVIIGDNPQKIAPAFLFVNRLFGKGEDALNFYLSHFPDSKSISVSRDPNTNTIMHSLFALNGTQFALMEGQGEHPHQITPAISFMVHCKNQQEVDKYWTSLIEDGGAHSQCGWLSDRFGVSWQIIPNALGELLKQPDPVKVERVMAAMLKMTKLDIKGLQDAAR